MRVLLCVLLAVLAGCASYVGQQFDAINRGDLAAAERFCLAGIQEGSEVDRSWYNLGIVYERTKRPQMAIQAFTMAARYGNASAQQALVSARLPVPAADLARPKADTSGVAAALDGFNRGYGGGVSCTSFGDPDMRFIHCR